MPAEYRGRLRTLAGLRAGPAKIKFKRQIGHAPINFTNLDLIFLHGVVHALIGALAACPFFLFLSRDMTDPKSKKIQKRPKIPKNILRSIYQRGQVASIFARAVRIRGQNFRVKLS